MISFMAVMAREAWTDERLDDLNAKVDRGFERVERSFERVDNEFIALRAEMNERFSAVEGRLDSLQRTMILCFASLSATILASAIGGVIAVLVTN